MKELIAKSGKQLCLALKLAFMDLKQNEFSVEVRESDKGKIYYAVKIDADSDTFNKLENSYHTMFM